MEPWPCRWPTGEAALEDAMYATAPPESLAAIIFRDTGRLEDALLISKSTAQGTALLQTWWTRSYPRTKPLDDVAGLFGKHKGLFV